MNKTISNEFYGKRLLYLGGISRARFVVQRARQLGAYVIVADYYADSPAKVCANEGVLVNALDVDSLENLCREKAIDGVMTGYCDILLPVCKQLADRLGLSCYYTDGMLRFTTDKDYFKQVSEKYSVPVPKKYFVDDLNLNESARTISYPVFIKPMDASGSRGASACYDASEFGEKFEFARINSKRGLVTVEELLTGTAFILDYVICDGEAKLLSMADCYARPGRPAAVNSPDLMILPSKNLKRYCSEVDENVKCLFAGEGFNNGLVFFQGYADKSRISFYEPGCRLGGTWPYIDQYYYGVNPMDMLFRHALTGRIDRDGDFSKISADYNGGVAAIIYFLSNRPEGKISTFLGLDELSDYDWVVHMMQYYFEGDSFDSSRQTDVRFCAVHLIAEDFAQLKLRINSVYEKVVVLGENGESLLAPRYDVDSLVGYER